MALTVTPAELTATALTLTTAAQPNITSVGTLTGLTVSGNIAGTLTTAAQPNITSLGTLTTLTVDDITINSSTISDASDLTFDVGGVIKLDADDAGEIRLLDGGTQYLYFKKDGTAAQIQNVIADGDIKFVGTDSSSLVTALTLDMSEAGAAQFNSKVGVGTSPSTLLHIKGDPATMIIEDSGSYSADSVSSTIRFDGKDSNGGNRDLAYINVGQHAHGLGTGSIDFQTRISGTVASRLKIDSTGNVGIGISPSNTFSVGASGTVTTRYTSTDTNAFSLLMFENSGSIVLSADHGDSQGGSSIIFKNDGAQERMKIDVGGHVGIATNVEADGTAMTSPLTVGAHNYGGNVFESHRTANSIHRHYMSTGGLSYFDIYGTAPQLKFRIAGADIAQITTSGLKMESGKGIDFASAANSHSGSEASLLNDYEEGTWTADINAGADAVTFSQNGVYVKIGAMVHIQWYSGSFTVANPVTGNARIGGLPFVPKSGYYSTVSFAHTTAFTNSAVQGWTNSGNNHIYVSNHGSTAGNTWSSGFPKYVMLQCTYYTDE